MYDEELEKVVLYYVIFEKEKLDLREDDFINPRHRRIIKAINEQINQKKDISLITINTKIKEEDKEALEYMTTFQEYAIGTNVEIAYNNLIELSKKRKLFSLIQNKLKEISDTENIEILSNELIKSIKEINEKNEKVETFSEQVMKTLFSIEESYNKRDDYSLYTGLRDLDEKILGLHNQEFTVIGARPGVGKTTLALQIAQKITEKGMDVAFISLEMSETQLIQKLIANKSKVNSYRLRRGTLEEKDFDEITASASEIAKLPLNVITTATTIQKIETEIRKLKNKDKCDLVIIDYIQLIKNKGKFNNREQEVADITRTLKLLSLELNIPIIGLCQLNRNASKEEPTLSDLRESGSIEQDADNVWFLYQEKEQDTSIVDITLKIAKQRAGDIGKIYLKFNKARSEFNETMRF